MVVFDACEVVSQDFSATVPEYPTEAGNKVSDSVLKHLPGLVLSGVITAMSLDRGGAHSEEDLESLKDNLKALYASAELCTVYSGIAAYGSLIIQDLSIKRDNSFGRAYSVDMTLKQMVFPSATVAKFSTSESYPYSGATANQSSSNFGGGSNGGHYTK